MESYYKIIEDLKNSLTDENGNAKTINGEEFGYLNLKRTFLREGSLRGAFMMGW